VLSDGLSSIMVDGFFSRPTLRRLLTGPVTPDEARIRGGLRDAGVTRLSAVLVAHSHHDHAMDAPYVAQLTGATVVGSRSTANIALGSGFPAKRIEIVGDRWVCRFGEFTVTTFLTPHSKPNLLPGRIAKPLPRSASVLAYKEGGSYSFHVAHPLGNVLIVPSRAVRPDWSVPLPAATVFLGMGGRVSSAEQLRPYWDQFVSGSGAKTVYPIHWDDFFTEYEELERVPRRLARKKALLESLSGGTVAIEVPPYTRSIVLGKDNSWVGTTASGQEGRQCRPRDG